MVPKIARMKKLIFQVAVGEVPDFYAGCMRSVKEYAARIGADYKYMSEPQLRVAPKNSQRSENALRLGYLPIFEKEFAFGYLGEYEAVAIIDADIYVTPYAPDVFDAAIGFDFAAVVERDLPLLPQYEKKLIGYSRDQYKSLEDVDWKWNRLGAEFYNMGMTVWSSRILPYLQGQSPKEFIERPEFERFVNGEGKWKWSTDQTLLNWWVKKSGMRRENLEWRWNVLYSYVKPESLALRPYFLHFNLASLFPQGGTEIPELVKRFA